MEPVPQYIDVKITRQDPYEETDPRSAAPFFQFTYQVIDTRTNTIVTDYFPMYHDYNGVDSDNYIGEIHLFRSTGSHVPPSDPNNFYKGKAFTRRVEGHHNYLIHVIRYEDGSSDSNASDPRRP